MNVNPYYLTLHSFESLKSDCQKQNYDRLTRLLSHFGKFISLIKKEPQVCYKLSNIAVKAQEKNVCSKEPTLDMLKLLRQNHVFSQSFVKEKCTFKDSNKEEILFNKTLLRFFCRRFQQEIQEGTCVFETSYSSPALHSLKEFLYKGVLPVKGTLADDMELYDCAEWCKYDELVEICKESIEKKITDLCKDEKELENAVGIWEKMIGPSTAFEKIALKAFFNHTETPYIILSTEAFCVDASKILLESDSLQKLVASHVKGLIITKKSFEAAGLLVFQMTQSHQLEQQVLILDQLNSIQVECLLSSYFRNKFLNIEFIDFRYKINKNKNGFVSDIDIDDLLLKFFRLAHSMKNLKKVNFNIFLKGAQSTDFFINKYSGNHKLNMTNYEAWDEVTHSSRSFSFHINIHFSPHSILADPVRWDPFVTKGIFAKFKKCSFIHNGKKLFFSFIVDKLSI